MGIEVHFERPLGIFKACPCCDFLWLSREELLKDLTVNFVGYQVNFVQLGQGIFLFVHESCGTTMAVRVQHFNDLYDGPVVSSRLTNTENCHRYCLYQEELGACPEQCECAFVREICQRILNWPKGNSN